MSSAPVPVRTHSIWKLLAWGTYSIDTTSASTAITIGRILSQAYPSVVGTSWVPVPIFCRVVLEAIGLGGLLGNTVVGMCGPVHPASCARTKLRVNVVGVRWVASAGLTHGEGRHVGKEVDDLRSAETCKGATETKNVILGMAQGLGSPYLWPSITTPKPG